MSNEFAMTLFEPEVILPAQMSWGARCDGNTSGARTLMLAILEDAMLCIERGRRRRHARTRQLAAEAETWMRADCREWLFSFASICDVLGIDADALRVRLLLTNVEHPAHRGGGTGSGVGVRMRLEVARNDQSTLRQGARPHRRARPCASAGSPRPLVRESELFNCTFKQ